MTTRKASRPATMLANNLPCMPPPERSLYLKLHMPLCLKVQNFLPAAFPACLPGQTGTAPHPLTNATNLETAL
jgi:hypothetical protein